MAAKPSPVDTCAALMPGGGRCSEVFLRDQMIKIPGAGSFRLCRFHAQALSNLMLPEFRSLIGPPPARPGPHAPPSSHHAPGCNGEPECVPWCREDLTSSEEEELRQFDLAFAIYAEQEDAQECEPEHLDSPADAARWHQGEVHLD